MKFERIPTVAGPDFLSVQPRPRPRLQLVPLAEDLVAAFFDTPDRDAVATTQLAAWSGDEALCLPLLGSRLVKHDGGLRYVFFLARSSRELCRNGLWITRDDRPLAEIDPSALQSPVVDALALVVGLAPDGERRLLRALLTTGQSLFGDRAFAGIRDIVAQLLERLAPPALPLRAWCPLGKTAGIASYVVPGDFPLGEIGTVVSVGNGAAELLTGVEALVEEPDGERLLHLYLPGGAPADTTLVALSETPLRLAGPSRAERQRPLGPWLAKRTPQVRRRIRNRLDTLAAKEKTAAALLAEISCPDTALPSVSPHLVCCTASGIYYIVGVRDPRHLLSRLVLRTADGDIDLPLGTPLHHPKLGPVQVGFAPSTGDCSPGDEAALFALYRSGRLTRAATVSLEPLPQTMPALLEHLPAADVAPSLAAALADTLRDRPKAEAQLFSVARPDGEPQVTLVVELGASLDYPFALAATLAGRRDITLMLHHPDRRALPALRSLGEELHAIYGFGVALLDIAEEDVLPAERLRAAIARAETDKVIFLSADALPRQRSWLEPWLAELSRPGPVLAGATVCGHDTGGAPHTGASDGTAAAFGRVGTIDASAFGLNAAARAVLARMPLRVAGCAADIADLATTLRGETGARVAVDPLNRMTAHARPPERPAALILAERLTLEGNPSA